MHLKLGLATLMVGFSVLAQGLVSTYSSIAYNKCINSSTGEGGSSATCLGPQGIALDIASGDWTNMWIQYKGKKFETWELVISAGSFNRIGGDNQVVEWVLDKSIEGQTRVHSLITRISGTDQRTQTVKSKLLVFGFTSLGVCYRGESVSNIGARQIAESNQCLKNLPIALNEPAHSK